MKKSLSVLIVFLILGTLFAGCGKSPEEVATEQAMKTFADLAETQQEIAEDYDPNDPEAAEKMMESYAELGAQLELDEFENAEAVDLPSGFPSSLVYGEGKVTEASDSGDESYINQSITIQTTDEVKVIKDFYKNLFANSEWKITSQSSSSDGASYSVTDSAGLEAGVDIVANSYSKIVNIYIWYSGSITE